jgi:hypothetical protein
MIRDDILQKFPDLFGTKKVNGREVELPLRFQWPKDHLVSGGWRLPSGVSSTTRGIKEDVDVF